MPGARKGTAASACAVALVFLSVAAPAAESDDRLVRGSPTPAAAPAGPAYREGEVLIRFRSGARAYDREAAVRRRGDRVVRVLAQGRVTHLRVAAGTTAQALAEYAADPNVESVQPNYIYRPLGVPNDPYYSQLWALANTAQTVSGASYPIHNPGTAGRDMQLERAWDLATDCRSVVVAVVDSGVNYTHRDLAGAMWDGAAAGYPRHGYDFIDNDDDPMPGDGNGHGTHVAATIGAVGNNGAGTTGVCWQSSIMAIRSLSNSGGTTASVVAGIEFAIAHGARVLNLSLGGGSFDPLFSASIDSARNAGVLVVAAAGNAGLDNDGGVPTYPCNFTHDNLVCVAALDQAYDLASFSNYGAASVDIGAPGTNTLSAWPGYRLTDDLAAGWATVGGGWAGVQCDFGIGPVAMLVNPAGWCAFGSYTGPIDQVAYKTFDLGGGLLGASVTYYAFLDVGANDRFEAAGSPLGGNPFVAGEARRLTEFSGTTGGRALPVTHDLSGCLTSTCTLGFRLRAESGSSNFGVGLLRLSIDTVQSGSDRVAIANGTSMATPHVAGLAALLWSYNPGYRLSDVVNAIQHGGEAVPALAGKTVTGRAASAWGALRHIDPPSAVSATVQ
ncbi:peptidase S8 and S53 subtilisin kexin sedolisin [Sulfurifustis variabilis]|uniref:Peptidase S8 and S53 subtilisin kexin sedolisin n=1 Tax=Sulfurifustis variabilis TaxID=1675686 RepID=A0A1B4VBY2_9GAMM|nr:S8 family serine peptidase [Sulfurifustis variabilis]BAU50254.1 peptidase S8 and S53 subtilisin kexin sedolisin [Sulfurifustis variabilis]